MINNRKPLLATILSASTMMFVLPDSASAVQANLEYLVAHERSDELFQQADAATDDEDFWPTDPDDWMHYFRPYVVKDGILQIPVQGVLLHKFPYQFGRWATGYQYIERALARGMEDANVKGIALLHDTPGGMVAGCFECVDKIYDARGQGKPIKAYASDYAYSAGYAIASAADDITVTRSGGVGSIGVVTAHIEFEKAMEKMGVKVTYVFAGAHKVDGNPYEALSESAKKRMQSRIDKLYSVFTGTVSRNRDMDEAEVRGTEALTYDAEEGIEVGLADKIGALDEELALFASEFAETGEEEMALQPNTTGKKPGVEDNPAAAITSADVDAARAEGVEEGKAAGATEERARITAILGSDEAKTRPIAAMSTAMRTAMSLEDAKAFLASMPEEAKADAGKKEGTEGTEGRNHFEEAMDKSGNPGIQTSGKNENEGGQKTAAEQTAAIFADFDMVSGYVEKPN